jgi:CRISPR-associated autoregulator DevR family
MTKKEAITHIAGTFLVQANGAFLNGAGLGQGDDRNVTIPKTFRDGRGGEVPYVSAQAWKRWLRMTAIEEAGWPPSEVQAIGWNPKGNVNKIAGQLNPVEYPEDDIFGYMRASKGQGRTAESSEVDEDSETDEEIIKTKAVMRASPFAASLLMSIRSRDWRGQDEGFVHLTKFDPDALAEAEVGRFLKAVGNDRAAGGKQSRSKTEQADNWKSLEQIDKKLADDVRHFAEKRDLDGLRRILAEYAAKKEKPVNFIESATSPLPYSTRFYSTSLQAIFCVDYSRIGVFWNLGDRIELEEKKVREFLSRGIIRDITKQEPYKSLSRDGALGKVYALTDQAERGRRVAALLRSLAVLRGGAKQAQFGTDVAPKAIVLAGLTCGNPIFNNLFADGDGGPVLKIATLREILADYSDRIVTPVLIGVRAGYLSNESDLLKLEGIYRLGSQDASDRLEGPVDNSPENTPHSVEIRLGTPIEVTRKLGELLE